MEPDHRTSSAAGAWTAALIVVAITLLSAFTLVDPSNVSNVQAGGPAYTGGDAGDTGFATGDPNGGGDTGGFAGGSEGGTRQVVTDAGSAGQAGTDGSQTFTDGGTGPGSGDPNDPDNPNAKYNCKKNENAGSTDDGISGGEIKMAATVVRTGIAKDFLADAQYGIEAVRTKINRQGGICNRKLSITYSDDGWNFATGSQTIAKWIGEKDYFGLIVNPSSEGLRGAIDGDLIGKNGFPVVGADGMLIGQYHEPWVWPIATSTHSVMQIMVNEAYKAGARKFAIAWENNYRFGVEGAYAFKQAIKRRCGNCKVVEASIKGGELSYKNQVDSFIGDCKSDFSECGFVALLLEPATASQWIDDGGLGTGEKRPKFGVGAPQPLFVDSFIKDCGAPCSRLQVWTSFKPPLHPFNSDPAVQEYVRDLRAVSSSADASNPHVQGAYVGASLFVKAMQRMGPAPTREGLRQVLDNMSFESGLAPTLKFSAGNHFAAVTAQAFEAIFNKSTFTNWQHSKGFVEDKEVHVDQLGY
jgi:ABC-type branched-subunit amino acid transport system substrate-binding protein